MADNPFYRFYRRHDVPMDWRTWERFPRVPDHKNEYWDGVAHYTPRPHTIDMYLDLSAWRTPSYPADERPRDSKRVIDIRPLSDSEWDTVPKAFHRAFADAPPLSGWGESAAARASRAVIGWTHSGRDGVLVRPACLGAWSSGKMFPDPLDARDRLCGAAIVVMTDAARARDVPPDAAVADPDDPMKRLLPHLTWIFVDRWFRREGVASALLGHVVAALRRRDFRWLGSTTTLGNSASLVWHWRNGFTAGASGWSFRKAQIISESSD